MKRFVCLLMTLIMVLGLFPTAALATETSGQAQDLPESIGADTVWSYLDDGTDPAGNSIDEGYDRTSWTLASFDDSQWKTAAGSFGAKNNIGTNGAANMLAGCYGSSDPDNYTTYFFRTHVYIEDASAVTQLKGILKYDDAVIMYINGVRVFGGNADGIEANMQYSVHGGSETDTLAITDEVALGALKNGDNVVAVELHNDKATSSDVLFDLSLEFATEPPVQTSGLITDVTQWSYLDDGTDPAGDSSKAGYDRTSWTVAEFDDGAWKTGAGPFGAKKNEGGAYDSTHTAATVLYGCDGKNDTPAYFFRTTFNIDSLEGYTKLVGSLEYDDGVIVYINGVRVAAGSDNACDASGNSLGHGFDANLQYGGSNSGPDTLEIVLLDLNVLHEGENTIAVELHNGRQTSSDIWFHLTELALSDEEVVVPPAQTDISLSMGADESQMNFTWYSAFDDGALTIAKYADLVNKQMPDTAQTVKATAASAASANEEAVYSNKVTVTGLEPDTLYAYQLTNGGEESEIYTFTTGGSDAFSFAYVGDPQIGASGNVAGDTDGWENTLKIIDTNSIFKDASFLLSAGDQVNTASDETQYDGYLNHDALTSLPAATVIGNHDSGSNAYGQHFNVANESADYGTTTAGGDSYFVYNNVLFMVLNSNDKSAAEHKEFMEAAIEATKDQDIQWKIVTFHHSIFTVASHSSDSYITDPNGFKNTMAPIFKELDIDVVLQGHDHVYCRTYMMDGLTPITESAKYEYGNGNNQIPTAVNDPDGILYVTANSGSGSKTYNIKTDVKFPFSAVDNQEHVPNVSKVTVSDKQFTITTYRTTDMSVVDTFTIKRDGGDSSIDQTNISLSMGADESQMNLTWYANVDGEGTLKVAKQSELVNGAMPTDAESISVSGGAVNKEGYFNYQTTMTGLEANTTYAYQLINASKQSKVYTFTTGGSGAFSFAYVGDPQIGAGSLLDKGLSGWKKTLGIIDTNEIFADASFMLSAGDQVNTDDSENDYNGYLNHDELLSLPVATVIGNHDTDSNAYGQHFNVANESDTLGTTLAGGDSYFVYNNVLFLVLNANDGSNAEHKQFMEDAIAATADQNIKWKVVSFHQSIYSVAHHSTSEGIINKRNELSPIFKDLDIDVVLMGHDHVYCRTYMMDGLTPITESDKYEYGNGDNQAPTAVNDPEGILYVTANSGSGSKTYDIKTDVEFPYAAVMNQEHVPNVSEVTVSDDQFTVTTYRTTDMSVVDTFTINRTSGGSDGSGSGSNGGSGGGSSSSSYAVTLNQGDNGTVTASSKTAAKGSTVTLTVKADSGYKLGDLSVTDKNGKDITLTKKSDGVYTFTMPASKVTVSASFTQTETPVTGLPFTDVKSGDWFYDGVDFVYEEGIMNGLSDTTFGPHLSTTRGMVVTMLWRMENEPQAKTGAAFADVKESAYYAEAIDWAAENGIVNGTSETTFAPDQVVTREQLSAILYRYSQVKGYDTTAQGDLTSFGDWERVSSYAVAPMKWAVGSSLIQGMDDNLVPAGSATRAQLATIFQRFITNIAS